MKEWGPQDWVIFMGAVAALVSAILTAINTFLTNLVKIQGEKNGKKVDDNTEFTKAGAKEATSAASAASDAKVAAVDLANKLNGELDDRVTRIIKTHLVPIEAAIKELTAKIIPPVEVK
jgi:hypothetical protein